MNGKGHYRGFSQELLWWLLMGLFALATPHAGQGQSVPNCQPACLPITVRRVLPGSVVIPPRVEPPRAEALKVPVFGTPAGLIGFGDKVNLSIPDSPADVIIEFSTNGGITWTAGREVIVDGKKMISIRSRQQERTSEIATASFTPYYRRMLVIGNSIMSHAPDASIGWMNFNGMAASAPANDFVHLLTTSLTMLNPQVAFRLQSGGSFERFFGQDTYSLDEFNEALQQQKPDLIVLRIGENVDEAAVASRNFEGQFRQLVDKLTMYGQPVKLVTTTSVWNRPQTDAAIRKVIGEKNYSLVDLSEMVGKEQYFASQYANPGVAAHPNDAGMQRIADLIWTAIR